MQEILQLEAEKNTQQGATHNTQSLQDQFRKKKSQKQQQLQSLKSEGVDAGFWNLHSVFFGISNIQQKLRDTKNQTDMGHIQKKKKKKTNQDICLWKR